ncbi:MULTISPECIES: methyltransferase domain-containing protein [Actinomadura]|uniref:Methyltransferase domain-containing protein n=1 Tax=Actinomadura yumaensis TaxID=111807 RepID=A0ABW2D1K3_9ACTN|nr:methyltransferase domain-containing protein [Actinomadura sp. J1-007]MWK33311.1 methyltransferase domain-containing protein [Actinomadura sp. J1-007]
MAETARPDPIGYLDDVAATRAGAGYKRYMLDSLEIRPGHAVLDVGCGPGTDLPALAEAAGPSGEVTGVDREPAMVDEARRRTAGLPGVRVLPGDAHALPLGAGSVDRARMDRVMMHLDDPARALGALRGVLRPGGLAAFAEPDWDTLAIDHPEVESSLAFTRFVAESANRNRAMGRQVPRLVADAGFEVRSVVNAAPVFRDAATAERVLHLRRNTARAVTAGYLDQDAAERWLAHLEGTGTFIATASFVIVVAANGAP